MNFIPYGRQTISEDDINSVIETLKSDYLTTGSKVLEFEKAICQYTGAKYCIVVSNGTAALHLSSIVLLKEKDKVITTPNSFLATSNGILYANAKPIFVDIGEDGNIDLDLCEKVLKNDTSIKALYGVHFSGNPLNQKKIKRLKDKYGIKILEDCAHSIGAQFKNVKAGSCKNSDLSIFSFHPVKHITTGEGGAITTNSKKLYKRLLSLRNHGMENDRSVTPWHYDMKELGFNYRLTDISCTLGLSQLKKLDEFIEKRHLLAKNYDLAFEKIKNIKSLYKFTRNSSYHLYIIKIDFDKLKINKKEFVIKMHEKNIGVQYHYIPINKQPFYKKLGYGKEYTPVMDEYYAKAISLPIYPSLSIKEQKYVIKTLLEVLNG
ncbi:UDP-4-amino-4,6-dideoxy-N-acetyl-beta-L-altrosamine transaminase [Arcobacter sp. LA11]|uniref:UDP-4-amino-4, 6-dideoxy-N-acetyl-beta-L-altrosamine transaminase n=1 Tax=Arcobacter sp. LA11 TaxID=1898176 RepID=UPI0009339E0A|nr:UDP-4-amino-4,6-dideoxy-N-acetyl-beta-L-altrosamine transaminase [Arcobacter sp. LA11]